MASKSPNLKVNVTADTSKFEKGMQKAQSSLGAFKSATTAALSPVGTAIAGITAAVAGVSKAVDALSQQNQALGDSWGRLTAGMTAAWDTVKTAIAGTNFTTLVNDMREATRLARDLYDAQDALGEIGTSYNISLAKQMPLINDLKAQLRDMTKSDAERVAAGEKLLKIYSDLEKNPTRGMLNLSNASLDKMADKLGYNLKNANEASLEATRREVEEFFIWLGTSAGETYSEAAQQVARTLGGIDSQLGQVFMRNAANNGMERFARLAVAYNQNVGDKDRLAMEEAVTGYYNQQAKYSTETLRIQTQISTLKASQARDNESAGTDALKDLSAAAKAAAADVAAVTAADEALRAEGDAAYEAWRAQNNMQTQLFDPELALAYEGVLQGVITREEELRQTRAKAAEESQNMIANQVALLERLNSTLEMVADQGFNALGEALGGLIGDMATGGDVWGNFSSAALSAFGDMAISVGRIAISVGLASEAIKASLTSLQGWGAIVAGTALVALGSAVKAGLGNIASGNYSASTNVASGSYSSSAGNGLDTRQIQVNVTGTLQADGSQLVAVLNNTNNKKGYTT